MYTVMTHLCTEASVEYVFNIKSCFRNFIIESMPAIESANADKKSMTSSDRSASS